MSFRLVHASGNMFMKAKRRRGIYTTAARHGDVLTFTEAQKDHRVVRALPGFSAAVVTELAIAWRRETLALADPNAKGARKVMQGGKHGRHGSRGDKRRRGPNRYYLWVVLVEKTTGVQWLIGVHHGPAKIDTSKPWRLPLALLAIANSAAELRRARKRYPKAHVIVDGDWNRKRGVNWRSGLVEAKTPATFGRLRYDRIQHSPDVRVSGIREVATPSDHNALVATVSAMGHATPPPTPPPTPQPKPNPTPAPKPEVPVTDDRYDRVTFRGKTVNKITRAALQEAEHRLGYDLTIVQGSYNKGVGASAGTHDGGGVVDLAPFDWRRKVSVLRALGFAAWHRPAVRGLWGEHIHAVLIGDASATPVAQRQVTSYRQGRDGLKSNRIDTFPHPNPIPVFAYPPKKPASVPNHVQISRQLAKESIELMDRSIAEARKAEDSKGRPRVAVNNRADAYEENNAANRAVYKKGPTR